MKMLPVNTTLKDGAHIHIREAAIQDAPDILQCVRTYIQESKYMSIEPEEFTMSLQQGREWIDDFLHTENSLFLVAVHNGNIVGNLDITGAKRLRLRHNGMLGMGMLGAYRSKGLGAAMMQEGIAWARHNKYLQRLWLQVLANNEAAINLYRKYGFKEEGLQKDFIQTSPGIYSDNMIMGLAL